MSAPQTIAYPTSTEPHEFNLVVDASLIDDTGEIRHQLRNGKLRKILNQANLDLILLIITEVITNIHRHAPNKGTVLNIKIEMQSDARYFLDISDNSTPFLEFEEEKQRSIHRIQNNIISEYGYGLGIIQQVSPHLHYEPATEATDKLNHLVIDITDIMSNETKPLIYIIDDDIAMCTLLDIYLRNNFRIRFFQHPRLALDAIAFEKPHLIISDLHMPDISGIQFREAINKNQECATIPFVFLSGDKEAAVSPYLTPLGIDDFICKPIKKASLLSVCSRLIERSKQIAQKHNQKIGHDITALLKPELPNKIGKNGEWSAVTTHKNAEHGGGDFVLHFPVRNGDIVILADVMGKGVEAKFFACAYAGYFRSMFKILVKKETSPDKLLTEFSNNIIDDPLFHDTIVTIQAFLVKPDGQCIIASAGHPPPNIYHHSTQTAEQISIYGPLPALSEKPVYQTATIKCNNNDILLFHTDGLGETNQKYSIIKETLKTAEDKSINNISSLLFTNFEHANPTINKINDDKTLITLLYNPQAKKND